MKQLTVIEFAVSLETAIDLLADKRSAFPAGCGPFLAMAGDRVKLVIERPSVKPAPEARPQGPPAEVESYSHDE